MRLLFLIFTFAVTFFTVNGQKNVFVTIAPKMSGADLQMATNYTDLSGVAFNLDHFDYYLSGLHVIHDGGQDLDLTDTVFLVEPTNHILYLGFLDVTHIEQLNFAIGVPANINTQAGADAVDISVYPAGHPLSFQDPSMYWGWTAGYMHMIVGGLADSNNDGIADAVFELHNVGDLNYRHVQLPVVQTDTHSDQIDIFMNCRLENWLKDIPIQTVGILHGSTGFNGEVMKNVETEIVFDQSATASIQALPENIGTLYFNSNNSGIDVTWKNVIGVNAYQMIDVAGKIIDRGEVNNSVGNKEYSSLANGVYTFQLYDRNNKKLNSVKIVK